LLTLPDGKQSPSISIAPVFPVKTGCFSFTQAWHKVRFRVISGDYQMSEPTIEASVAADTGDKKKSKKLFVIVGLVALLLVGAGGGYYFLSKSSVAAAENKADKDKKKKAADKETEESEEEVESETPKAEEKSEKDQKADKTEKPAEKSVSAKETLKAALPDDSEVKHIVELQPFIINLADSEEARYLRLSVSLGIGGEESGAKKPDPLFMTRVKNAMLAVLTVKKSTDVLSIEGKVKLRKELLQAAQAASKEPKVEAIYITDFIVQL